MKACCLMIPYRTIKKKTSLLKKRSSRDPKESLLETEKELLVLESDKSRVDEIKDRYIHALESLQANPSEGLCRETSLPLPFPLPSCLPIGILTHRPDIQIKLHRAHKASKEVDVAEKAFYPTIDLLALLTLESIHFGDLFRGKSLLGIGGGLGSLPLFHGGALVADLGAAGEAYNMAVEDYNNAVLQAVREVKDALTLIIETKKRYELAEDLLKAQEKLYRLAFRKKEIGSLSPIQFLDDEKDLLDAKRNRVEKEKDLLAAALLLIEALGTFPDEDHGKLSACLEN